MIHLRIKDLSGHIHWPTGYSLGFWFGHLIYEERLWPVMVFAVFCLMTLITAAVLSGLAYG